MITAVKNLFKRNNQNAQQLENLRLKEENFSYLQEIERLNCTINQLYKDKNRFQLELQDCQFEMQEETTTLKQRCEDLQNKLDKIADLNHNISAIILTKTD